MRWLALASGFIALALVAYVVQAWLQDPPPPYVTRCANHAIQLRSLVWQYCEDQSHFPEAEVARTAFRLIGKAVSPDIPDRWFEDCGYACPEAYESDGSLGYVFLASGLPTRLAMEQNALIFVCPSTSHLRLEHCHALRGYDEFCVDSNRDMIGVLEAALEQHASGKVPYSAGALQAIKSELRLRRQRDA